jgi:hypothetical protein
MSLHSHDGLGKRTADGIPPRHPRLGSPRLYILVEEALMTRRQLGLVCFCLLIVVGIAPAAWPQAPAVDPQSLIGQWSGTWVDCPATS